MTNNPRYTLGTEANRIFMASETYELLKFGKGFPAPNGGSPPTASKRGSPAVWPMCIRLVPCSDTWVRAS